VLFVAGQMPPAFADSLGQIQQDFKATIPKAALTMPFGCESGSSALRAFTFPAWQVPEHLAVALPLEVRS